LRPKGTTETVDDRATHLLTQPQPITADQRLVDQAIQCAPLIRTLRDQVTWTDLGRRLDTQPASLQHRYQRISVITALSFAGYLDTIRDNQPTDRTDPELAAADFLCCVVRTAREDPYAATALLTERLETSPDSDTIRRLVPIGAELAHRLGDEPHSTHERTANLALTTALTDTATSPAQAAALALHQQPN
jgi:hypothetical protein